MTTPREGRRRRDEGLVERRTLLDGAAMQAAIDRIAKELAGRTADARRIVLIGIRTGGVHLAERLQRAIAARTGHEVPRGNIDITLYRDDLFVGLSRPEVGATDLPGPIEGKHVVLVDDVLFTGRTTRSALMELMDYGRPEKVELAVLVDRGWRELPIQADYVGLTVETTRSETVRVQLRELGETDRVVLFGREGGK